MKTSLIISLVGIPLAAIAAQNRFGATDANSNSALASRCDACAAGGGAGCGGSVGRSGIGRIAGGGAAGTCSGKGSCVSALGATTATTLPAAQLVPLLETERLSRDLYAVAARTWSQPFARITSAETRHEDAFVHLAATAALVVPVAASGTYATADLQHLYNSLLPMVAESRTAALRAAAFVEETDLAGLRRLLAGAMDPATETVLTNLEVASRQHLRAFVRNLSALGVTYTPQVLTAAEFDEIIDG